MSEVELLLTPLSAGRAGAVTNFTDRGRLGGDVDVDVDELHVAADVRVDTVKDGLEQVRDRPASVRVDEASVGNFEHIAVIVTGGIPGGEPRRGGARRAFVMSRACVRWRCGGPLVEQLVHRPDRQLVSGGDGEHLAAGVDDLVTL